MKRKMTLARAQAESVTAIPKTVAGHKVWPITYGHVLWLRDIQKNSFVRKAGDKGYEPTDFDITEVCFAFTQEPLALQSIRGPAAKKRINELLLTSSTATLSKLFGYAIEQIEIHAKTMSSPKKQPAAPASRKRTAARPRKRSSSKS